MRLLVSGASGLIGTALVPYLRGCGHEVVRLVRRSVRAHDEAEWNPDTGKLDPATLARIDAVVNLSGENLADQRWTPEVKRRLWSSRVDTTSLLAARLAERARGGGPAGTLVSVSAMGIYGDRGDEPLTEASSDGTGFLASLVRAWEDAAAPARGAGVRVAHPRLGLVMTARGGSLAQLLPPFRFGVGGPLAGGRAWWSWVAIEDVCAAFAFALERDIQGPFNVTAPNPVRNAEFTRTLARVLHRPAFMPVPAFALRILLGELAGEVLSSAKVLPAVLRAAGFEFKFPELEPCLRQALSEPKE